MPKQQLAEETREYLKSANAYRGETDDELLELLKKAGRQDDRLHATRYPLMFKGYAADQEIPSSLKDWARENPPPKYDLTFFEENGN